MSSPFLPKNSIGDAQLVFHKLKQNLFLQNYFWLIFEKVVKISSVFVVNGFLARFLGPSDFGTLNSLLVWLSILQSLASLGAESIILKEFSSSEKDLDSVFSTALLLRITSAGFLYLLVFIFAEMMVTTSGRQAFYLRIVSLSLFFMATDVFELYFFSRNIHKFSFYSRVCTNLVFALLKITLILVGSNFFHFIILVPVEFALLSISFIFIFRRVSQIGAFSPSLKLGLKILRESSPLLLASFATAALMRLDQAIVERYLGISSLGLYSAILNFNQVWYALPVIASNVFGPEIMRLYSVDKEAFKMSMRKLFFVVSLVGCLVSSIQALVLPSLFLFLHGADFAGQENVLRIHALATPFVFVGVIQSIWAVCHGNTLHSAYRAVFGLASSWSLCIILVPKYGLSGAAFSTVIAQAVSCYFCNYLLDRDLFICQSLWNNAKFRQRA